MKSADRPSTTARFLVSPLSAKLRRLSGLSLIVFFSAVVAYAQRGTIAGTVSDASSAVVQGAEITVRNTATNESHKTTSGATGAYALTNLPVGPYEVSVRKDGFKLFRQPNVELTVAQ